MARRLFLPNGMKPSIQKHSFSSTPGRDGFVFIPSNESKRSGSGPGGTYGPDCWPGACGASSGIVQPALGPTVGVRPPSGAGVGAISGHEAIELARHEARRVEVLQVHEGEIGRHIRHAVGPRPGQRLVILVAD